MSGGPNRDPRTLTRWILKEQQKHKEARGDLSILLNSVQLACKIISRAAAGAGMTSMYGLMAGGKNNLNSSGDQVKKLDAYSNDVMINCLSFSGKIACMASEECENAIIIRDCDEPKYVISFDPLDGSSNIDANVSIGTIFGIHRVLDPREPQLSLLQRGRDLVCAGYAMYGDATVLVLTLGDEVNGFTLDTTVGEFILTHRNIRIPSKGKIYSVNEGHSKEFDKAVRTYIENCKEPKRGKSKKLRYIGSMVADVHRTLLYGGIFMYPSSKSNPRGKLRMLYELNPMSFIVETAGGKSSNGKKSILDITPTAIHARSPVFLGSEEDVNTIEEMYREVDRIEAVKKMAMGAAELSSELESMARQKV